MFLLTLIFKAIISMALMFIGYQTIKNFKEKKYWWSFIYFNLFHFLLISYMFLYQ